MTSLFQLGLMVGPLALYFYTLAVWQAGRHPHVVSGALDLTLLAAAVGGLLLFGPVGQALTGILASRSGAVVGLVFLAALASASATLLRQASRRLVVYHADAESLHQALGAALGAEPGAFTASVAGFEDRVHGRGIRVDVSPLLGAAVVEAFGAEPDALIRRLRSRLRSRLRETDVRPSPGAWILLGLSAMTMLAPLMGVFLTHPQTRAALRALLERLQGG